MSAGVYVAVTVFSLFSFAGLLIFISIRRYDNARSDYVAFQHKVEHEATLDQNAGQRR